MIRKISLLVLLVFCGSVYAGGFSIVPLRVELGKNRSSSITITNADEAKTYEVRAVSWTQQNRSNNFEPSNDLIIAPTTFKLEKGASQVVRIQLNRALNDSEVAYRVFVDEVAEAPEIRGNTLKTLLSMAVPVFVAPKAGPIAKGEAELKASLVQNTVQIEMKNMGKANLKLLEWVVSSEKAGELLRVPSGNYVLAGNTQTGSYPLKIQAEGPLVLKVVTDRGTFSCKITR